MLNVQNYNQYKYCIEIWKSCFLFQLIGSLLCLFFRLPNATLFSQLNLQEFQFKLSFLSKLQFITCSDSRELSKLENLVRPETIVGRLETFVQDQCWRLFSPLSPIRTTHFGLSFKLLSSQSFDVFVCWKSELAYVIELASDFLKIVFSGSFELCLQLMELQSSLF